MTSDLFKTYEADFVYCETVIKKHSKSFYTAFSMLPREKAQSIYAVYAFCRRADDIVDLEKSPKALDNLRQELVKFEKKDTLDDPMWRALAVVFETFPMSIQPFYDMLEGQRRDIDFQQPTTQEDLTRYAYYVAGTVGLMLLPLLSAIPNTIKEPAIQLGEAMQITNILRDIGEDYREGRIYLPKEEMAKFGVTEETLAEGIVTESFIQLWENQAKKAEELYQSSEAMLPSIDPESRLSLIAASRIYREILQVIRENQYQVFTKRQAVSKIRKVKILSKARLEVKQNNWGK